MESPKSGIIIKENPLFEESTPASNLLEKESHLEIVSIMLVDVMITCIDTRYYSPFYWNNEAKTHKKMIKTCNLYCKFISI